MLKIGTLKLSNSSMIQSCVRFYVCLVDLSLNSQPYPTPHANLTPPNLIFPPKTLSPLHRLLMEVGVPPLPPRSGPRPTTPTKLPDGNATDSSTAMVPFHNPTYVIQVPKEQIFRVPPPENANIMKEYQERIKNEQRTPRCWIHLAWILAGILLVTFLGFVAAFIYYLVAKPGGLSFTVDSINVVHPSQTKPDFDITVTATNPSATMDFYYAEGGEAKLSHKGVRVASGDPPSFNIENKDKREIKLSLRGSNAVLPKEIQNSLKGTNKDIVDLSLSADFPMKLGFGYLPMRAKELSVDCDVRVSKMGKETHIMSQNCETKLS